MFFFIYRQDMTKNILQYEQVPTSFIVLTLKIPLIEKTLQYLKNSRQFAAAGC